MAIKVAKKKNSIQSSTQRLKEAKLNLKLTQKYISSTLKRFNDIERRLMLNHFLNEFRRKIKYTNKDVEKLSLDALYGMPKLYTVESNEQKRILLNGKVILRYLNRKLEKANDEYKQCQKQIHEIYLEKFYSRKTNRNDVPISDTSLLYSETLPSLRENHIITKHRLIQCEHENDAERYKLGSVFKQYSNLLNRYGEIKKQIKHTMEYIDQSQIINKRLYKTRQMARRNHLMLKLKNENEKYAMYKFWRRNERRLAKGQERFYSILRKRPLKEDQIPAELINYRIIERPERIEMMNSYITCVDPYWQDESGQTLNLMSLEEHIDLISKKLINATRTFQNVFTNLITRGRDLYDLKESCSKLRKETNSVLTQVFMRNVVLSQVEVPVDKGSQHLIKSESDVMDSINSIFKFARLLKIITEEELTLLLRATGARQAATAFSLMGQISEHLTDKLIQAIYLYQQETIKRNVDLHAMIQQMESEKDDDIKETRKDFENAETEGRLDKDLIGKEDEEIAEIEQEAKELETRNLKCSLINATVDEIMDILDKKLAYTTLSRLLKKIQEKPDRTLDVISFSVPYKSKAEKLFDLAQLKSLLRFDSEQYRNSNLKRLVDSDIHAIGDTSEQSNDEIIDGVKIRLGAEEVQKLRYLQGRRKIKPKSAASEVLMPLGFFDIQRQLFEDILLPEEYHVTIPRLAVLDNIEKFYQKDVMQDFVQKLIGRLYSQ